MTIGQPDWSAFSDLGKVRLYFQGEFGSVKPPTVCLIDFFCFNLIRSLDRLYYTVLG